MLDKFKQLGRKEKITITVIYVLIILFFGILIKNRYKNGLQDVDFDSMQRLKVGSRNKTKTVIKYYEFPSDFMVWVSNEKKPLEFRVKYKYIKDNKKVPIQAGTKVIALKRTGKSFFTGTRPFVGQVKVAFDYEIKKGFITKPYQEFFKWKYPFEKNGINFTYTCDVIPKTRFSEVLGGTTSKILTLSENAYMDKTQKGYAEDVIWLKMKNATKKYMNSHSFITKDVKFLGITKINDFPTKPVYTKEQFFGSDSDYSYTTYTDCMLGYPELENVFRKIKKDEHLFIDNFKSIEEEARTKHENEVRKKLGK